MNTVDSKIRIGISSCLLGNHVRYDGGHQYDPLISEILGKSATFIPVCPELECGLGVPRETMQLMGTPGNLRLFTTKTGIDHTTRLRSWALQKIKELMKQDLQGFILKSRSPSCGISRVKVFDNRAGFKKMGIGLFAEMIIEKFPELPIIDEENFHDVSQREKFLARVFSDDQES